MRQRILIAALLLGTACAKEAPPPAAQQAAAAAQPAAPVVVADSAIKTPESILYDPIGDVYLVSNINGSPAEKDNNGYISRVSPDGKMLSAKWIAGGVASVKLDAPKGTGLRGDTLFVADITVVRLFNRNTGAPLGDWAVPGATFLNDLTVGPDGTIYLTDSGLKSDGKGGLAPTGTDAVYTFDAKGKAVVIAKNTTLGAPNGVLADSSGVTVVTFASGAVYHLDKKTHNRTDMPKPPKGSLDGIVRLADNSILVSSWEGNAVYRLAAGGTAYTTAVDSATSPADIGYDTKRGRLLIPSFTQNKLMFRDLR
jgi:sugar lactone lactonase YvrE